MLKKLIFHCSDIYDKSFDVEFSRAEIINILLGKKGRVERVDGIEAIE